MKNYQQIVHEVVNGSLLPHSDNSSKERKKISMNGNAQFKSSIEYISSLYDAPERGPKP